MPPIISRGFRGRRDDAPSDRVPPGQYATRDFPVLSAGPTPHRPLEQWDFSIVGEVDEPRRWTWEEVRALPSEEVTGDIHCVTKWSNLDTVCSRAAWTNPDPWCGQLGPVRRLRAGVHRSLAGAVDGAVPARVIIAACEAWDVHLNDAQQQVQRSHDTPNDGTQGGTPSSVGEDSGAGDYRSSHPKATHPQLADPWHGDYGHKPQPGGRLTALPLRSVPSQRRSWSLEEVPWDWPPPGASAWR